MDPERAPATLQKFYEDGWFPGDGCIVTSENGSMTKAIMPVFMRDLDRAAAANGSFPSPDERRILVLDGHSSRNGIDWLDIAKDRRWEVVKSPANTSHFLQSCDHDVNKKVNKGARDLRDAVLEVMHVSTKTIHFKVMAAVAGHNAITPMDIHNAWDKTGLWPMNFRFLEFFPETRTKKAARCAAEAAKENQRQSDTSVYLEMRAALGMKNDEYDGEFCEPLQDDALEGIQKISANLEERETTTVVSR